MLGPEDSFDLQRRYARLAFAMDSWDIDGWAAAFSDDAVFIVPPELSGREAIREWATNLKAAAAEWPLMDTQHHLANINLDGDGYLAHGSCYYSWLGRNRETGAPQIGDIGLYVDRWERRSDGWLLTRREIFESVRNRDQTPAERVS